MQGLMPAPRAILTTALLLAGACLSTGCAGRTNYYADPSLKETPPENAAAVVEAWYADVHIIRIDGKPVKTAGMAPSQQRLFWVPAGIHNFVVYYATGRSHSLQNAEVTFALEPGHRYGMTDWPPKVKDKTTGKPIACRLAVADE
jgi:hypothetical protein